MMPATVEQLYGFGTRRRSVHRISLFGQILLQRISHHRLVINHQNTCVFILQLVSTP